MVLQKYVLGYRNRCVVYVLTSPSLSNKEKASLNSAICVMIMSRVVGVGLCVRGGIVMKL